MSMRTRKILSLGLIALASVGLLNSVNASSPETDEGARVSIDCTRGSGLIQLNILHHRKIGKVHIVVRDAKGKTVYVEEGKAMTGELVRRLDKGIFPKGEATLTVEARDFSVTKAFTIQ